MFIVKVPLFLNFELVLASKSKSRSQRLQLKAKPQVKYFLMLILWQSPYVCTLPQYHFFIWILNLLLTSPLPCDTEVKYLLPSQAFFLLGSILNLPGLKFYLLYCEQGKTRPHDRTASELGKQGIFFPSRHTLEKKFLVFLARQKKKFLVFLARQEKKFLIFLARQKIKFLFSSFSSLPKFSQNSQNTSTQIDHLVRPSISGYEMV